MKKAGKNKVIWTNGCFDIIHPGHIELFKYARSKGDLLFVGIDTDKRVKELKELLINSAGVNVVQKTVQIALDDDHPAQMAALKLCMDRMLPVTLFEKEGKPRSAITINITGIGEVTQAQTIDAEDIEAKNDD